MMSDSDRVLEERLMMDPLEPGETWKDRVVWPSGKPRVRIAMHWDGPHTTTWLRAGLQELAEAYEEMLVVAFVQGAKWWEYQKEGATMWQSDQTKALEEAEASAARRTLGVEPGSMD